MARSDRVSGRFNEMMELYWQINPARVAQRTVSATYAGGAASCTAWSGSTRRG